MKHLYNVILLTLLSVAGYAQCTGPLSVTITGSTSGDSLNITENIIQNNCNSASGVLIGAINITVTGGSPAYNYSWTASNGGVIPAGTENDEDLTGLPAGTYTVVVTDQATDENGDSSPCMIEATYVIIEPTPVEIDVVGVDPLCHEESGTLNGTVTINSVTGGTPGPGNTYTYDWETSDGEPVTDGQTAQTGLGGGTYCVTVSDAQGCTADTCITLAEPAEMILTEAHTDLTCHPNDYPGQGNGVGPVDGSIDITISGGTVAGDYTYTWSPVSGGIIQGQQDQSDLEAGTYTVVITDDNGCSETVTVTIEQPDPILVPGSTQDLGCNSGSGAADGAIDISPEGGTPFTAAASEAYTYSWTGTGTGLDATAEDQTGLSAGDYTVVVTDSLGCTNEATFTLGEPTAVSVTGSEDQPMCNDNSGALDGSIDITPSGGTPYANGSYTYAWTVTGGTIPPGQEDDQDLSDLGTGIYTVVVTDSLGCTVSESWELTEPSEVTVTGTPDDPDCHENSGELDGSIDITPGGGTPGTSPNEYTYAWTTLDGNIPAGQESVQDPAGLGGGTYTVVVTDGNGCSVTENWTLTEPSEVTVTGTPDDPDCNENSGALDGSIDITPGGGTPGTSPNEYTYAWTTLDGNIPAGQESVQDPTGLGGGTYTVVVTDGNGCSVTANWTLTEPSEVVVTGTPNNPGCNVNSGSLDGSISIDVSGGTPGTPAYTFLWTTLDGTIPAGQETVEDPTGLGSGTYTVVVTDDNGCTDSNNWTLLEPTEITITPTVTQPQCNAASGALDGSISIAVSGGTPDYSYDWSNIDPDAQAGAGLNATNENNQNLSNLGFGTYVIIVTDDNGCVASDTIELIEPDAIAAFTTDTDLSCNAVNGSADGEITFVSITGGTVASDYSFNWTESNGGSGIVQGQQDQTGLTAGTYNVTISDDNNCTLELSFDLLQPDSISIAETLGDLTCNSGNASGDGSISISVSGGTSPYSFAWTASNGGTIPAGTENDQNLSNLTAGTYTVVVTDGNLCTTSETYDLSEPTQVSCNIDTPPTNSCGDHIDCNGDDIDITSHATGGNGPYTFSIDGVNFGADSVFTVGAGTHTITVRDVNNCESTCQIEITQPEPLTAGTCVPEHDECQVEAGQIEVQVAGGCPPYTVTWTSNNATSSDPNNPEHALDPVSATINASEGSYIFNNAVGGIIYTFTVTDANGCVIGG